MISHSPNFFAQAIHAIEKFHRALPKSLRIRIQRWVEKLVSSGGNAAYVRHRDAYTKLMLNMILKRKLEEPFHTMPPDGQLPPFPSHLKVLLKPPFGQEEHDFWHQVITRVHEEASAHKDISTDTAVHGSRIANNSSIHGLGRSPYQGAGEESNIAMKSAMHHRSTQVQEKSANHNNEDTLHGIIGRHGIGAGVAGVLDVETPLRHTPGRRGNHVVFSEAKGVSVDRETGRAERYTPSKYGGVNHSSFVGGDAPQRSHIWQQGHGPRTAGDDSKNDSQRHGGEKGSTSSFWRQDYKSLDFKGVESANPEYSRILNQVKSRNPPIPENTSALRTLVQEQQVRISILEEQIMTMGAQYEHYINQLVADHAKEVNRLRVTVKTTGVGPSTSSDKPSFSIAETGKQLFPRGVNDSTTLADQILHPPLPNYQQDPENESFRSSVDFAREYPSVIFDNGVGQGITTGTIGDPNASMVGAGYPKLSRSSPDRARGIESGRHHIHIASPPGKLGAKLPPHSPIGSVDGDGDRKEIFDVHNRPPPPPFPTSLVLKQASEGSSPSDLAASVQTQRWVNLSREGI